MLLSALYEKHWLKMEPEASAVFCPPQCLVSPVKREAATPPSTFEEKDRENFEGFLKLFGLISHFFSCVLKFADFYELIGGKKVGQF